MENISFDEIINSVSLEELQNPAPSADRHTNIAVFARFIANGHVGWDSFSEENKEKFRHEVENLYNLNAASDENLLKEMETLLIRCIPDNHAFVMDSGKNKMLNTEEAGKISDKAIDKYPETHVGKNSAYSLADNSSDHVILRQGTEDFPISISEITTADGKRIGVVAMSKCPQPSDAAYNVDAFCQAFQDNYQNWDAVVLDVRGNQGGDDKALSFVSSKLYGTAPRYHRSQEIRITPEAKILQEQKIKSKEFLDELHFKNPNGYKSPVQAEPKFNEQSGYNKNIYILTDRKTSSSAEFICGLRQHPKVKYLGENTCGCGEYGDTAQLALPNGGYLNMGMYKNELFAGIKEGEGLAPTHRTEAGKDAFEHCLKVMEKDFYIQNLKARVTYAPLKSPKIETEMLKNLKYAPSRNKDRF